jgi:hypothetical protein
MSAEHDKLRELLASYALGACSRAEAARAAEHFAECEACGGDLRRLREGVRALQTDVTPLAPGPGVKQTLMAQVHADATLFDAARARFEAPAAAYAPPARPWWRVRPAWPRAPFGVAALACALALAITGGVLVASVLRSGPTTTLVARATVDPELAPGASGTLKRQDARARLNVDGLPAPGPGRVYQVWVRAAGRPPQPANATFTVDSRGRARVDLSGDMNGVDQMLVSSEPSGGSDLPTRLPVLHIDF